jgi:hypothetical protein
MSDNDKINYYFPSEQLAGRENKIFVCQIITNLLKDPILDLYIYLSSNWFQII